MNVVSRLFRSTLSRRLKLVLVMATRHEGALAALDRPDWGEMGIQLEQREAFTTGGVYDALAGAHLVLADLPDLVESGNVSREQLVTAIAESGTPHADGAQFAADPDTWLEAARSALGVPAALPPRTAAFISLSGGVGKTTLALDTAAHFHRALGLPAVVLELGFGPSGQAALLGHPEWPHLYEIVTQQAEAPTWRGVTLIPMQWDTARLLSTEQAVESCRAVANHHILTLIEGHAAHPFWPALRSLCQATFVISDGRLDALAGAAHLIAGNSAEGQSCSKLVLNRAGALARLGGLDPAVSLPAVRHADRFDGELGRRMLPILYPGWRGRKRV